MINKQDIQKMIKHVARRSRNLPDRRLLRPHREWVVALSSFVVVLVIGGAFSAERFHYLKNIDEHVVHTSQSIVQYRQGTMESVLEYYQARQEKFLELRGGITLPKTGLESDLASTTEMSASSTAVINLATSTVVSGSEAASSTDSGAGVTEESDIGTEL